VAPNYISYWFHEISGALVTIVATLRDGLSSNNCKTEHTRIISTCRLREGGIKKEESGKKEVKRGNENDGERGGEWKM
jgi:hypothetical protein